LRLCQRNDQKEKRQEKQNLFQVKFARVPLLQHQFSKLAFEKQIQILLPALKE